MARDFPLDDSLLVALREVRPVVDDQFFSPDSEAAQRLLASILGQTTTVEASPTVGRSPAAQPAGPTRFTARSRRHLTVALAVLAAVVFATVALAQVFGGFGQWLSGEPGVPASKAQQRAFDRATRSWQGFPPGTTLRVLAETSVGGATYTLYGFRAAGTLCLRLVVSGDPSGHQLACTPLSLLRSTTAPALVSVVDAGVGFNPSRFGPRSFLSMPDALVTFGIVADGVREIEVADNGGAPVRATVHADAFLWVDHRPSFGQHLSNVWAIADGRRFAIPFTPPSEPFSLGTAPAPRLSPHGPSKPQRIIKQGRISWLVNHVPVGSAVPKSVHRLYPKGTTVLFQREIAPNPGAPERIVVGLVKPPYPAGVAVEQQVCANVVGGRFGSPFGCWYASELFGTAPGVYGSTGTDRTVATPHTPFNWTLTNQQGNVQDLTIAGLTTDAVASMRLFLGTGQQEPVAHRSNAYIVEAPSDAFPARLVAYDSQHRIIGVATFPAQGAPPSVAHHLAGSEPAANSHWHLLLRNSAGTVFSAPSATGGTCYTVQMLGGGGSAFCTPPLSADALQVDIGGNSQHVTMFIQTGAAVERLRIHYEGGRIQTLTPTHGVAIIRLAAAATLKPRQGRALSRFGIVAVTALNANGQVIASRN